MKDSDQQNNRVAVDILSKAFDTNPSVNYVVGPRKNRERRIKALMAYAYAVCQTFGKVWISEDKLGCALILFPDRKRFSWVAAWRDVTLAFTVIGIANVGKVLRRESNIKKFHPKIPYGYLWFIGVTPDRHGSGIGSNLLKEVLRECDAENRAVYLETSVESNLAWYRKYGFEVYQTLDLGCTLYLLKRENNPR